MTNSMGSEMRCVGKKSSEIYIQDSGSSLKSIPGCKSTCFHLVLICSSQMNAESWKFHFQFYITRQFSTRKNITVMEKFSLVYFATRAFKHEWQIVLFVNQSKGLHIQFIYCRSYSKSLIIPERFLTCCHIVYCISCRTTSAMDLILLQSDRPRNGASPGTCSILFFTAKDARAGARSAYRTPRSINSSKEWIF